MQHTVMSLFAFTHLLHLCVTCSFPSMHILPRSSNTHPQHAQLQQHAAQNFGLSTPHSGHKFQLTIVENFLTVFKPRQGAICIDLIKKANGLLSKTLDSEHRLQGRGVSETIFNLEFLEAAKNLHQEAAESINILAFGRQTFRV